MKKLFFLTFSFALVLIASCEKNLSDSQQELTVNPVPSYMRIDSFDYMGHVYSINDYPDLFNLAGGYFWYYDSDGTKHWYFPYSGDPYFCPPYDPTDVITDPINPTPTPSQSAGKFIHNTIKDIMNASASEISTIISANLAQTYSPLVSLSAKINNSLLSQVATGNLIISEINESYSESTNQIIYNYVIHYQDVGGNDVDTSMVSFVYRKGMFTH